MGTLRANVRVGSTWYGPAHGNAASVPDDVAEQITNPAAWEAPPARVAEDTRKASATTKKASTPQRSSGRSE